jgi:iron-sulfur cluster insertion protein
MNATELSTATNLLNEEIPPALIFTDAAATKVKSLIDEEDNDNLMLRVFVTGGGCSGFQYGFTFDENSNEGDTRIEKGGVTLLVDPMSIQYLTGAEIDYKAAALPSPPKAPPSDRSSGRARYPPRIDRVATRSGSKP